MCIVSHPYVVSPKKTQHKTVFVTEKKGKEPQNGRKSGRMKRSQEMRRFNLWTVTGPHRPGGGGGRHYFQNKWVYLDERSNDEIKLL